MKPFFRGTNLSLFLSALPHSTGLYSKRQSCVFTTHEIVTRVKQPEPGQCFSLTRFAVVSSSQGRVSIADCAVVWPLSLSWIFSPLLSWFSDFTAHQTNLLARKEGAIRNKFLRRWIDPREISNRYPASFWSCSGLWFFVEIFILPLLLFYRGILFTTLHSMRGNGCAQFQHAPFQIIRAASWSRDIPDD